MFKISFEFDETTETIKNVNVVKTNAIIKAKNNINPVIELDDNKIILSPAAVSLLNITAGERISINYYQVDNEITFPVISKSEYLADKQSGNKLTKSNTIAFKGNQRKILFEYGSVFKLEEFKPNIFKLLAISDDSSDVYEQLEPEVQEVLESASQELPF